MHIAIFGLGCVTRTFEQWPERVLGERLLQQGHNVVAYGYHDPASPHFAAREEEIAGIRVRRLPPRFWPARALHRAMAAEIKPDVAHILHPRNVLAFSAVRLLRRWRVPLVYTWLGPFHDAFLVRDRESPYDESPRYEQLIYDRSSLLRRLLQDGRLRSHLRNYMLHWPLTQADLYLPCSQHEADVLVRMGMPAERMRVVPLWIEAESLSQFPQRPPEQSFSRPLILYIGQITRRKGPDLLVQAMPEVLERYPQASFVFVSHNPAGIARLRLQAESLGVMDRLYFVGQVSEEEKVALLRDCDVYVLPSRYEGFGLPLLEAMACGTPLISSDIPVVNEIVRHGENGWLIPRDDSAALAGAILRIVGDGELRARLAAGGARALGERYDGASLVQRVLQAYREAIALAQERVERG
ncbi:MAG: glycosyltransferase family 4 protein [Chloroflexia bacterium]|nr:glycosyltransferase family 4 protein [Chloroflexia bacterium]